VSQRVNTLMIVAVDPKLIAIQALVELRSVIGISID
jgi:hypothetical protein